MLGKLGGWDDTIVALATPPGVSAIGIIRLSGKESIHIVNSIFPSKDLLAQPSHTLHVGFLHFNNTVLDEVVIGLFKSPRSYTGEDVVEISGHGSPFVLQQIIDACIAQGARMARPGEFSQRAFLNGKLDLTQAEAVADLIESNSSAAQKAAITNMRGGFSKALKLLRDRLLSFSALIELELDFSQEDVEFADRSQLEAFINEAQSTTTALLQSFKLGNVIRNGVQVAIIGKPNAGKSTLLNALLNENRAIVSAIAGTTRDTIEEQLNIDGIIFRLVDTAGIRDHSTDDIERMGIARSLEKMNEADLIILLFDVTTSTPQEIQKLVEELRKDNKPVLAVANKVDILQPAALSVWQEEKDIIFISAMHGRYIELIKEKLLSLVLADKVKVESAMVTNARHYEALQKVNSSLADIREGMNNKIPGDLIALDIRRCLHWLGEITGEITNEDQLDYIFSKFCIGK